MLVVEHDLKQTMLTRLREGFDQLFERHVLMRLGIEWASSVENGRRGSSCARSTKVLMKKPISPWVSWRGRLAPGTPMRMSVCPL